MRSATTPLDGTASPPAHETTPLIPGSSRQHANRKKEALGLILMTLSALAFSSMSLFVKLSGASFPSLQIVFARSLIQAILGLFGCAVLRVNPLGKKGLRGWVAFRGFVGTMGLVFFFYSITKLPLADATVIFFLGPTFTAILAALALGESFTLFDGACALLCMVGAALVSKPSFLFGKGTGAAGQGLAFASAFAGAMMSAVAYVTVRRIGKAAHFLVHTVYFGVVASIVTLPATLVFQEWVWPQNWSEYGVLLLTGLTAFIGQCLINLGLQLAPAGPGTLMRMNDVVFAFLFGICILHEYPDMYSVIGATLIVLMTSALGIHKWYRASRALASR